MRCSFAYAIRHFCRYREFAKMPDCQTVCVYGDWAGSQQTRDIKAILFYCWACVDDAGPTLKQHWFDIPCFAAMYPTPVTHRMTCRPARWHTGPGTLYKCPRTTSPQPFHVSTTRSQRLNFIFSKITNTPNQETWMVSVYTDISGRICS